MPDDEDTASLIVWPKWTWTGLSLSESLTLGIG